jgi:hypothetical protein
LGGIDQREGGSAGVGDPRDPAQLGVIGVNVDLASQF